MIENLIRLAPTIGTIFFFLTFCYVIYSVFKKDSGKKFDQYSKIPFNDREK
ncbi:MAG: CcoQ/FixQ family Cbb3-type cytochrome c oxidase assembly chaperone [Proteobacteria bacterium]|nr:CcoQ/FixQ family Cbb3-type cytochrome c oxidase assembly chaperone [Pseudomonadota bacterium]